MLAYRASSVVIKSDFVWLTTNTSWTPRDAYMAFYFGKYRQPRGTLPTYDPNPPPYPIPDPHPHYCAVQARILTIPVDEHPTYTIDTTTQGAWRFCVAWNGVSYNWAERRRWGHTYPTTPVWDYTGGDIAWPMTHQHDNVYSVDLHPFLSPTQERQLYFYFYIAGAFPNSDSRGHSPLYTLRVFPRSSYHAPGARVAGGPIHTHGTDYMRAFQWIITHDLYPARRFPYITRDAPIPPGPLHVPPS
jgi:hypothetical protein